MTVMNTRAEVLVLDTNGNNLGRMSYTDAKVLSESRNLDLAQVNKKDDSLPVYKIMDYGKWKYQNSKNKKQNKSKSHTNQIKEIGFKVRTESHDMNTKITHIKKFISKGFNVKISVSMKGREKSHPEIAENKLTEVIEEIKDMVQIRQRGEGSNSVYLIVRPIVLQSGNSSKDNLDVRRPNRKDN